MLTDAVIHRRADLQASTRDLLNLLLDAAVKHTHASPPNPALQAHCRTDCQ